MPDSAPPLPTRLRLAVTRLNRRLRQESGGDVTPSMLSALASIERLGPLAIGELAGVERVQPPSMTKIVARLEEQGLVTRESDAADRRVARVGVSDEGHALLGRIRTRRDAYLADRLRSFTEEERQALERALPLLERLLEDQA